MAWILIYVLSGSPITSIGPMQSENACKIVQRQIDEHFKPKKSACIMLPPAVLP